jgi:hypothetical protein
MNISKITLTDGGLKGIKVEYTEPNEKDGRSKFDVIKKQIKHPIHLGLEKPFNDLRVHLLEIFGIIEGHMNKAEKDAYIAECNVTGIVIGTDEFTIVGEKEVFGGKYAPLATPKIDIADEYYNFEAVVAIIKTIIEETKSYMAGEVKVTDEEAFERWMEQRAKAKPEVKSAFEEMSPEEQKEFMSEILQNKFGAVVMLPEDFTVSTGADEEAEQDAGEDQGESIVIDLNSPEPIKIPAK